MKRDEHRGTRERERATRCVQTAAKIARPPLFLRVLASSARRHRRRPAKHESCWETDTFSPRRPFNLSRMPKWSRSLGRGSFPVLSAINPERTVTLKIKPTVQQIIL